MTIMTLQCFSIYDVKETSSFTKNYAKHTT